MASSTYLHGHHESVLAAHRRRTAENSCAYLLDHLHRGATVLDVGCGPGTITVDLARIVAPGTVVALDAEIGMLQATAALAAERQLDNVTVVLADAMALPWPDATFDIVHLHQVLQHVPDPRALLRECRRVCRPGGIVAARDADYAGFLWSPLDPDLDRWQTLYEQVARALGASRTPGVTCSNGPATRAFARSSHRQAHGCSQPPPNGPGGESPGRDGPCSRVLRRRLSPRNSPIATSSTPSAGPGCAGHTRPLGGSSCLTAKSSRGGELDDELDAVCDERPWRHRVDRPPRGSPPVPSA